MTPATTAVENTPPTPDAQFEQDVQTVLASAIAEQQHRNFEGAEQLYRFVLEVSPHHADANFNMGGLALERRQPAAAVTHCELAVAANPDEPRYWAGYIEALIQSGETDAARLMLTAAQQRGLSGPALHAAAAQIAPLAA
jgi:Flp pilus assembly protein TadD